MKGRDWSGFWFAPASCIFASRCWQPYQQRQSTARRCDHSPRCCEIPQLFSQMSKHQATCQDAVTPVNHNNKWDSLTSLVHQLLNVWTDEEKTNSFHRCSYFHQPTTRWQQPTTAACSSNLSVFDTQSHDFPASVHPPTWTAHCAGYVQIAPICHSNPTHNATHTINLCATSMLFKDWSLIKVLHPTQHKIGHFGDVPQANLLAWYGKTKNNTEKHTFTNQKKCTTTQNKHKKTKARFSRLLRHLVWKRRGPIQCFINLSLTYLLKTHNCNSPGPTRDCYSKTKDHILVCNVHYYLPATIHILQLLLTMWCHCTFPQNVCLCRQSTVMDEDQLTAHKSTRLSKAVWCSLIYRQHQIPNTSARTNTTDMLLFS